MPETERKDSLQVQMEPDADGLRVVVAGELDISTASGLRTRLNHLTPHESTLTIDVEGIEFMDSTGLGVLIEQFDRWTTAGGGFRVTGAQGQVKWLLGITGLDFDGKPAAGSSDAPRLAPA